MCKSHRNFSEADIESILQQYNIDPSTFESLKNGDFTFDASNDEMENSVIVTDN